MYYKSFISPSLARVNEETIRQADISAQAYGIFPVKYLTRMGHLPAKG
jgi:hypothetical protein